ncbi:hypothetical protein [Dielma fastidiosa]|uniref:hypothetical protein n=1 Tax=Dielma fastidiosa TaxID=1034346 RepID=UPI0023EFDC35|nr:hypothetical protein [Dielma fastidiosa]
MKQIARSILDIDGGNLKEKADYKLSEIMANIADVNSNPKTVRELNIKIRFKPVEDGGVITSYTVTNKLGPMKEREMILNMNSVKDPLSGQMINVLIESSNQAKGQLNLDGEIFEPEMVLIGIGAENLIKKETVQNGQEEK